MILMIVDFWDPETRGAHPHEWKLKINIFNFFPIKMTDSQDFVECPWSRSNILSVSSVTLVLTIVMGIATAVGTDIAAMCAAIAASTATIVTTIVAVVHIGICLALVWTFSCPVSRFATSVAVSRLGASWLSAHLGLKQGIDLSDSVHPISRSNGLEGGRRSSFIATNVLSWWPLAAISLLTVGILSDLTDGLACRSGPASSCVPSLHCNPYGTQFQVPS